MLQHAPTNRPSAPRWSRPLATAAATATALATLSACGADTSTPDGLGQAVADAASDGDIDTIKELTCAKDRSTFAANLDPEKIRTQLKADDLTISVEFVRSSTDGANATLTFKTIFDNMPKKLTDMGMPSTTTNNQTAQKQGNTWTICDR